jgi:tetratricopeptide (TPR) repeat protein
MSGVKQLPDNVIPFSGKAVPKFGFKRVKRRLSARMEAEGQLNLFDPRESHPVGFGRGAGLQVARLPTGNTPFVEALLLDEQGDERAADMYWKAITLGDSVADAYCNLGIIAYGRGETGLALNCFTNSLEADPRHFEAHYDLANVHLETGDLRLARLHYELAAEVRPDDASLYFNLGLVHAMNEDYKAAIVALSNYKELSPEVEDTRADSLLDTLKRTMRYPG